MAKMSPEERSAFDYYWNISRRSAVNTLKAAKDEGIKEAEAKFEIKEKDYEEKIKKLEEELNKYKMTQGDEND